jgi:hypothetical protein
MVRAQIWRPRRQLARDAARRMIRLVWSDFDRPTVTVSRLRRFLRREAG